MCSAHVTQCTGIHKMICFCLLILLRCHAVSLFMHWLKIKTIIEGLRSSFPQMLSYSPLTWEYSSNAFQKLLDMHLEIWNFWPHVHMICMFFYCMFAQFIQFPVLDFGLDHYMLLSPSIMWLNWTIATKAKYIEESEKAWVLNPGHLACAASDLPYWATTTGQQLDNDQPWPS